VNEPSAFKESCHGSAGDELAVSVLPAAHRVVFEDAAGCGIVRAVLTGVEYVSATPTGAVLPPLLLPSGKPV